VCSRCLAASFRPRTDPTMSRKIEDRYERLLLPLFDRFEAKAVAAFESKARELAAPTVGIDLEWLRVWLDKTIEEVVIKPSREKQGEIVKRAYRQGVTWADTNLSALTVGAKLTPGPIDWRALDVLKARNVSLMTKLGADLNAGIIEGLTEGLMQGESIPHLAKRLQNAVQVIGRTRAETIARTETMYCVNEGSKIRYAQAGVSKVKILVGLDERTCGECEPLHGNVYEIGSEPQLPIHPRCRCCYSPVVEVPK
jgi:SPP1 gp7 family putative phage head morphogenesis protein